MSTRRTERPLRVAGSAFAVLALLLAWFAVSGPVAHAQGTGSTDRAISSADRATGRAVEVRGGNAIYSSADRCTVGFNARSGSVTYALVRNQCTQVASTWYADAARSVVLGTTAGSSFPGNGYGVIRYTSTSVIPAGEVSLGSTGAVRDITGAGNPAVGMSLCHVGQTTGYRCGTVTAVNVTVSFPDGVMSGLFRSNICSESGDVGGPAFSGGVAIGVIVGATGTCSSGGATYYQPVMGALAAYGLTVY